MKFVLLMPSNKEFKIGEIINKTIYTVKNHQIPRPTGKIVPLIMETIPPTV